MTEEGTPPVETPPVETPLVDKGTPWHAAETYDADTRGWLENRGLTKLEADAALPVLIKGFRNAEQKLGVPSENLLKLPTDRAADGAMDPVYNALGRPEKSGEYQLPTDSGNTDADFATWAQEKFHAIGLSQDQASKLYGEFVTMVGDAEAQSTEKEGTANQAAMADLKREWGTTYERNMQLAQGAIRQFGVEASVIDKMEELLGFSSVIKLFNTIGQKIGEDSFVSGDNHQNFPGMPSTPEGATQRINELKRDAVWVDKYLNWDVDARQLMTNLQKVAAQAA